MASWKMRDALRWLRPAAQEPSDPHLAPLTKPQADELRSQIQDGFREHGYDITFAGRFAFLRRRDDVTVELDLGPLIEGLQYNPSQEAMNYWVDSFITAAVAVDDAASMTTAEIYRALRLVVMPRLPENGRPLYADHEFIPTDTDREDARLIAAATVHPVGDDLLACFALDTGDAVVPGDAKALTEFDELPSLVHTARANTSRVLADLDVDITYHSIHSESSSSGAWLLYSRDLYLSATVLELGDFLRTRIPEINIEEGVLFSMPVPSTLLVHEVGTGPALAQSLHALAGGAAEMVSETGGDIMLSPLVHLWHNGLIESVSSLGADGDYVITPNQYLTQRLHEA